MCQAFSEDHYAPLYHIRVLHVPPGGARDSVWSSRLFRMHARSHRLFHLSSVVYKVPVTNAMTPVARKIPAELFPLERSSHDAKAGSGNRSDEQF